MRKLALPIIVLLVFFSAIPQAQAAKVYEQLTISDGITYKDTRYSDGKNHQAVRVIQIDLTNPFNHIDAGMPSRLGVERTTVMANGYDSTDRRVVGAINASFFWAGMPLNLISKNNQLVHSGHVYSGSDKYVNKPIAFGVDQHGKGIIDYYNLKMRFIHNGNAYEITSTNQMLDRNKTILYTSYHSSETVTTNEYFMDIVVTLPSHLDLTYGKPVTGTVQAVYPKGQSKKVSIPKNGFVLSNVQNVSNVKVGDAITLTVDIDSRWKGSAFMIASGPLLVENGKINITMDTNSLEAKQKTARTAVAVDKTEKKIFLVTVDGKQPGYSNGMSLTEFAKHLRELGAYRALNLDGGGSTTMALRYPGTNSMKLVNKPADGYERAVPTILMAISTAPEQMFKDVYRDYWAISSIASFHTKGIISGYPDGTFRPNNSITREEAAIMLAKVLRLDTKNVTNPGFKDVKTTDKYYRFIAAVANAGIVEGKGNKRYGKKDFLTRAEMAAILVRAFNIPKKSINTSFPDVKRNHWGYEDIESIVAAGIAGGYPDGTYRPDKPVTRAEFTVFLDRVQK